MEVILLIGIPACGKSSFYRRYFSGTHLPVSRDMLRTPFRQKSLFEWCLAREQSCVIDDTNTTREVRATWIAAALAAGATVRGYYFQSKIDDCLGRNSLREGKARIPDAGVRGHHSRLERPSLTEGFERLDYVILSGDGFEVHPWNDEI
jgi:predicted kinase